MTKTLTIRQAARTRQGLDGSDAQALEGALCQAERELAEARSAIEILQGRYEKLEAATRKIARFGVQDTATGSTAWYADRESAWENMRDGCRVIRQVT